MKFSSYSHVYLIICICFVLFPTGHSTADQTVKVNFWQCNQVECDSKVAHSVLFPESGWYELQSDGLSHWFFVEERNNESEALKNRLPMKDTKIAYDAISPEMLASSIINTLSDAQRSEIEVIGHVFYIGLKVNDLWWLVSKDNPRLILTTSELSFLPLEQFDTHMLVGVSENRLYFLSHNSFLKIENTKSFSSRLRLVRQGKYLWLFEYDDLLWSIIAPENQGLIPFTSDFTPIKQFIGEDVTWRFQKPSKSGVFEIDRIKNSPSRVIPTFLGPEIDLQAIIPISISNGYDPSLLALDDSGAFHSIHVSKGLASVTPLKGTSSIARYIKSVSLSVPSNAFRLPFDQLWEVVVGDDSNGELYVELINIFSDRVVSSSLSNLITFERDQKLMAVNQIEVRNGILKLDVIEEYILESNN